MKAETYTMVYAALLGIVCASMLTAAGELAAPYREANKKAEEVRNILGVLGVPFDPDAGAAELTNIYDKNVQVHGTKESPVYQYVAAGGKVLATAIPLAGPGLWGPIKGVLALEADGKTIRGVSFHEQEETPGLGGEIGEPWFQDQFKGKQIVNAQGEPGIRISREGAAGSNEVDAITGATLTCDKVQTLMNNAIRNVWREEKNDERSR